MMIAALKVQKLESLSPKVLLFGTGGRVQRTEDGASALKRDLAEFIPGFPTNAPRTKKGDGNRPALMVAPPKPSEPTPPASPAMKPALGGSF